MKRILATKQFMSRSPVVVSFDDGRSVCVQKGDTLTVELAVHVSSGDADDLYEVQLPRAPAKGQHDIRVLLTV